MSRPGRLIPPALVLTLAMALAMTLTPVLAGPAAAGERLVVGAFSAGDLAGWEVKSFKGLTDYTLVPDPTAEGGRTVLRAESRGAASGLFKEVKLDLRKYPLLRWSWRVEGIVAGGDESLKAGDDYAARVYVVFPHVLFWRTRAINYIWANRLAKGAHQPNVFSAHAMMVAAESGDELAGRWVSEERDVVADYRLLFGEEPPALGAVAIMTDTDNTGGRAVAYYGDISLAARD